MFDSILRAILRRIVAKRLGILKPVNAKIESLGLGEYVESVFKQLNLNTVGDVLEAYVLHHDTPGVGKKSWDDFFNKVS
tara:strand:- start:1676 stop:1912 length:237 start_codon:yes stop_codon:yes gene_type:complete